VKLNGINLTNLSDPPQQIQGERTRFVFQEELINEKSRGSGV